MKIRWVRGKHKGGPWHRVARIGGMRRDGVQALTRCNHWSVWYARSEGIGGRVCKQCAKAMGKAEG